MGTLIMILSFNTWQEKYNNKQKGKYVYRQLQSRNKR